MAFDFGSGVRGAQAGSVAGPYGAAAGFIVGGFVGGGKMAKAKAKKRREENLYRQHLQTITSPEYFGQTVQKMLPSMREAVASGLGPQEQSAIATSLARGGYTDTGIGEVGRAVGIAMPQIEAYRQAVAQATPAINRELEGFLANARSKGIDVGYGGGEPLPDPFGSAGGLVNSLGAMGSMGGGGGYGGISSMFSPSMSSNYGQGFGNFSGSGGGGYGTSNFMGLFGYLPGSGYYLGSRPGPDYTRSPSSGWQMPSMYTAPTSYGSQFANLYPTLGSGGPASVPLDYTYQRPTPRYNY